MGIPRSVSGRSIASIPDAMNIYDTCYEDTLELPIFTDEFQANAAAMAEYMEEKKIATVADLVKAFPEHERMLFAMLDYLRLEGKVHWDEWRPLPTLIHAGDRRISEDTYKYNWSTARDRTWTHRLADLQHTKENSSSIS
jgi:hypothetical protein